MFFQPFGQMRHQKLVLVTSPTHQAGFGVPQYPDKTGEVTGLLEGAESVTGRKSYGRTDKPDDGRSAPDTPAGILVVPALQRIVLVIDQPELVRGAGAAQNLVFHQDNVSLSKGFGLGSRLLCHFLRLPQ